MALTTVEVCGDIQTQVKQLLERGAMLAPDEHAEFTASYRRARANLQRSNANC